MDWFFRNLGKIFKLYELSFSDFNWGKEEKLELILFVLIDNLFCESLRVDKFLSCCIILSFRKLVKLLEERLRILRFFNLNSDVGIDFFSSLLVKFRVLRIEEDMFVNFLSCFLNLFLYNNIFCNDFMENRDMGMVFFNELEFRLRFIRFIRFF